MTEIEKVQAFNQEHNVGACAKLPDGTITPTTGRAYLARRGEALVVVEAVHGAIPLGDLTIEPEKPKTCGGCENFQHITNRGGCYLDPGRSIAPTRRAPQRCLEPMYKERP